MQYFARFTSSRAEVVVPHNELQPAKFPRTGTEDNSLSQQQQQYTQPSTAGDRIVQDRYFLPRDVSSRFGRRLRLLRTDRKLTQLQLAIDLGIDRSFISDVERGRKSISLTLLEVVAIGMNMSLSELLRDL